MVKAIRLMFILNNNSRLIQKAPRGLRGVFFYWENGDSLRVTKRGSFGGENVFARVGVIKKIRDFRKKTCKKD